jgi:hypothetical protein
MEKQSKTMIQLIAPNHIVNAVCHGDEVYEIKNRRVMVPIAVSVELTKGIHGFTIAPTVETEPERNVLRLKK